MKIIKRILNSELFINKPPVLIDIGASGEINPKWKKIARYSICIAFDADDRELDISENKTGKYKKLLTINRVVSIDNKETTNFYLTSSPFCSSTLKPNKEKLKPWLFSDLFEIEKTVSLPAISIQDSLNQIGVDYIDWFKADTQGTDLRIFSNLPATIKNNLLAAEFEPGIIDAYEGEDKLHSVLGTMDKFDFWLSSMNIKGTQRYNDSSKLFTKFTTKRIIKNSPCWAEVTYLHTDNLEDKRQLLMLFIFAVLERQYGFAIEVAEKGLRIFNEQIFEDCKKSVISQLKKERLKIPLVIFKKQLNKILSKIND